MKKTKSVDVGFIVLVFTIFLWIGSATYFDMQEEKERAEQCR